MAFGLYLHFPFCRNKCSYCDFYKEIYDSGLEARFYDALRTETDLVGKQYAPLDNEVATIYVGGGTPSITSLDRFEDWLNHLKSYFQITDGIEFSFENNPESVTVELLERLQAIGVTRPTFGIQSFNKRLLRRLNRKHNITDSHRAVYLANALGFKTFGVDLLFGLPGQTSRMLAREIDDLLKLDPPHISYYQLIVEEATPLFDKVAHGKLKMPDERTVTAQYLAGVESFDDAGYERYEVSSFAKPGHECRHNIGYWEGRDYLGLGPSGHSFLLGQRFANTADVHEYIARLEKGERPLVIDESGMEQRMLETIMLGLRTARGIDRRQFAERFGTQLEERLHREQYDIFVESGHLIPDRGMLRLSDEGILVADEITRRLVK